jgi:hypothetical protein
MKRGISLEINRIGRGALFIFYANKFDNTDKIP